VLKLLNIEAGESDLAGWAKMVERLKSSTREVRIAAVGKYVGHDDAYKSINEAFVHAGIENDCCVKVEWVDSEQFEKGVEPADVLKGFDGILVGPGFGSRGIEGKIRAVQYARENKIPFLGICLGMQVAVIEIARNCAGLSNANSTEFDPETDAPIISLLSEQKGLKDMGGTMRLGAYRCDLKPGTLAHAAYGADSVDERHRHRYEFNNSFLESLAENGTLVISGTHMKGEHELVEIIEVKGHPWFCASQFHPEFNSTPLKAQPLFRDFVSAALKR
ncbi:MAG: CTP synthase, partial [Candidatus Hydrogenedentes bacterium]|nr:CTP synthase [Candidatus Hydrogenedentota bacterium]